MPPKQVRSSIWRMRSLAIRKGRRIRLVDPRIEKEWFAKGVPFSRIFASENGKLYGGRFRLSQDFFRSHEIELCEIDPKTLQFKRVVQALVQYRGKKAIFGNVGKGIFAKSERFFGRAKRSQIRPRGLDVMGPILEMVTPEAKKRGINRLLVSIEDPELEKYYARFGFKKMKFRSVLSRLNGKIWMQLKV